MKSVLRSPYPILCLLTLLLGIAPFAVYHYEIGHGILTNADDWYRQEASNHGPWRYSWEHLLIFYPQFFLASSAVLSTLFVELPSARLQGIAIAGLIAAQVVMFALQFIVLGWTFD